MLTEARKRHKKTETEARKRHMEMPTEAHKKQTTAHELPLNLIESEILPRLATAKSVGRCMCVSKHWKSFLSTPAFAKTRLQSHVTIKDYKLLLLDGGLLCTFSGSTAIPPYTDPSHGDCDVLILASLDGLVCVASRKTGHRVFWNPLTGAYRKLPPNPDFGYYIGLDDNAFGFYIDDSCNDYRLLHLIQGGNDGAYVYSRKLDSWREIEFSVHSSDPCIWSAATCCGQCLYFVVRAMTFEIQIWIVCFDVKTETFRKIQFPHVSGNPTYYSGGLVVLNGGIHLCVSFSITIDDTWQKQGHLWRMDGDDGWVKVAAFSEHLYKEFTRQHICTVSNGDWVAVLDKQTNSFKKLSAEEFIRNYRYFCCPSWEYRSSRMIYVETLVSP